MRLSLPITAQSTSPYREAIFYAVMTIFLTWLFWLPGAFMPSGTPLSDLLLAIGSFVPLAVAVFLEIWLQQQTLHPMLWVKTLTLRAVLTAVLLPVMILIPLVMVRTYQGTTELGKIGSDAVSMWFSLVGVFVLALAEEIGWRAYFLARLKSLPLYLVNLIVGLVWFTWQLPLVLSGRYNESENFGSFLIAMFLYALLITPFLNRLAMRSNYNPILSAIARAGLLFVIAVYFLQGRADPLTDTFGTLMIGWLVVLNVLLFSQLWQGKKPPAQISELDRVMPDAG